MHSLLLAAALLGGPLAQKLADAFAAEPAAAVTGVYDGKQVELAYAPNGWACREALADHMSGRARIDGVAYHAVQPKGAAQNTWIRQDHWHGDYHFEQRVLPFGPGAPFYGTEAWTYAEDEGWIVQTSTDPADPVVRYWRLDEAGLVVELLTEKPGGPVIHSIVRRSAHGIPRYAGFFIGEQPVHEWVTRTAERIHAVTPELAGILPGQRIEVRIEPDVQTGETLTWDDSLGEIVSHDDWQSRVLLGLAPLPEWLLGTDIEEYVVNFQAREFHKVKPDLWDHVVARFIREHKLTGPAEARAWRAHERAVRQADHKDKPQLPPVFDGMLTELEMIAGPH